MRRSPVAYIALALALLVLSAVLLAAGWLAWILLLRPAPAGFAPTSGQAAAGDGQPPGVLQYTVDARSRRDWAYFSFRKGATVAVDPNSDGWDLAFRRTDLLTNSGDTHPEGRGGAIDLKKVPLVAAAAPDDGYQTDTTHEERGVENPALHKWYRYNWTSHIITSREHTYALRTAEDEVVLLTFVSYYCGDGAPGCVTFRYVYSSAQP